MKKLSNRIAISFLSAFVIPSLCLIVFTGCDEVTKYSIWIQSPADVSTFESGDSIPFSMSLTKSIPPLNGTACIDNGTIIQWTSSRDGNFWQEEILQKVCEKNAVTYEQEFSTSALSAGDHTITCGANKTDETGTTYNLATAQVRIYIKESQTSSTTTTATDTTTTIAATSDRFIDNGDGTVTDTRTGLIWLKNAKPCPEGKTWADAGTYCSSLKSGMAGLTDGSTPGQWRLPTVQELEGIGTDPPTTYCIDDISCTAMVCPVAWTKPKAPFTNNPDDPIYWSNASYIDNPDNYAWTVFMYNGYVNVDFKTYSRSTVWPVRGGN